MGSKIGSIGGHPQLKGRTTWGTCALMHMHREQREKVEILCERIPGPHVCLPFDLGLTTKQLP